MNNLQKIIYSVVALWSILAGYFALSDLQLSNIIVDENTPWAQFLQQFGEIPGLIIIIVGIFIFAQMVKLKSKKTLLAVRMFFILGETFTLTYLIFVVIQSITGNLQFYFLNKEIFFIFTFLLSVALIFSKKVMKISFSDLTFTFSKIVVSMAIFGYVISIQIVKIFWGRVRYRDLDTLQSNFTEWYLPQGITGNESFPSGHAAMAWMILPLLILIPKENILLKTFTVTVIATWGILVPLSRIIIGAHYSSDVLFGSLIILASYLFFYKKYIINMK